MEQEKPIKRIQRFAQLSQLSIGKFEEAAGINHNVIQNAIQRNSHMSDDTLAKIMTTFPELSIKWILTGKGEMLLTTKEVLGNSSIQQEPSYAGFIEKLSKIDDKELAADLKVELFQLYQSNSDLKTDLLRVYKLIGDI